MKFYQLTYLITPDIAEEELKKISEKISGFILTEEGVLDKTTTLIRKKLAYPIKEKREAFSATLNFYLNPEKLENFEKKLKSENQILRYLLLTKKVYKKIAPKRVRIKPFKISKQSLGLSEAEISLKSPKKEIPPEKKDEKVELKEIDKKIDEILKE